MRLSFLAVAFFAMLISSAVFAQNGTSQSEEIKTVTVPGTKAELQQKIEASKDLPKAKRSAACSSIEKLEPVGVSDKFSKDLKEIFYFTHITNAKNLPIKIEHRWYHKGENIQTTVLPVKSASWRTHSKRTLLSTDNVVGEWRVEAVDQASGAVLSSSIFFVE
ncbi:MAG: DUF2914 domain-containing protein [Chitinispirillales bacterium]|jgi:hypothetical protein|nr:DUF2914 domain-containing protein [Chitinispirillales bacterium]